MLIIILKLFIEINEVRKTYDRSGAVASKNINYSTFRDPGG